MRIEIPEDVLKEQTEAIRATAGGRNPRDPAWRGTAKSCNAILENYGLLKGDPWVPTDEEIERLAQAAQTEIFDGMPGALSWGAMDARVRQYRICFTRHVLAEITKMGHMPRAAEIGKPISRAEALHIAGETLEAAERERKEAAIPTKPTLGQCVDAGEFWQRDLDDLFWHHYRLNAGGGLEVEVVGRWTQADLPQGGEFSLTAPACICPREEPVLCSLGEAVDAMKGEKKVWRKNSCGEWHMVWAIVRPGGMSFRIHPKGLEPIDLPVDG